MKMKKSILALLLALVLVLSLTACGEKLEKKVVGTWSTDLDMTEVFSASFGELGMDPSSLPSEKIFVSLLVTFNEDKTCTLTAEVDVESFNAYMVSLTEAMVEMMYQIGESSGLDRETFDEAFASQYNMSVKEYVDTMLGSIDAEQLLDDMEDTEGTWKVENDKIIITDKDSDDQSVLRFEGDNLILEEAEDLDEEFAEYGLALPWTFTKK